jgi:glycosyltransferase involved in cell wall biosynthesis
LAAPVFGGERAFYVDVSVVHRKDWHTGIQRVVRAMLAGLPAELPPGWRLVPVFAACVDGSWVYKDAGGCPAPGSNQPSGPDGPPARRIVNPLAGDVFLGLDLAGSQVVQAGRQNYYARLRENWVKVYFVVYDLLPLTHPEYFSPEDGDGHRQWLETVTRGDGVLCISRSVAAAVKRWLRENEGFSRPDFTVDWFHLGADLENSRPSTGITEKARMVLGRMDRRPSFLVVGTIEPRKRCDQVLGAFERLWSHGLDANLVFAGSRGWGVDALVEKILHHPERDHRLFWLQAASDECLEKLYTAATCLVAASADEGFGLPLIEAARRKLPVIARDIPVFREVAGEHAFYFPATEDPDALALAIDQWMNLFAEGKHPPSDRMPWLTWRQSAAQLVARILPRERLRNGLTP